jgi:3-oxoacyl-[acyl-carrier protein] reductase
MKFDLEGQVAIVTGAARGIGKSTALLLARNGASVILDDVSESSLRSAVNEITSLGGIALPVRADVSDPEDVRTLVSSAANRFGRIDILVNNAGIPSPYEPIQKLDLKTWQHILDVNLRGPALCTREVSKIMIPRHYGRIVNVSSIFGEFAGIVGSVSYVVSKAAIIGFTKNAALELGPKGINVTAVTPGFVETEMTEYLSSDQKSRVLRQIPVGRFATPEEIASVICFLASPEASYMNGSIVDVHGGRSEYSLEPLD